MDWLNQFLYGVLIQGRKTIEGDIDFDDFD